jgi:ankyrin repeat protein
MGEFTRTKLQQYHISWESAHLLVARSCMCYISICLKRGQGSAPADVSSCTGASSQRTDRLHPMSQRLLDYVLDDALDHFGYLGSKFESALPDITVLAEDIRQHSEIWDNVCIPARWKVDTKPRWPAARHDLLLYIFVAFAPKSFMGTFFRDNALRPREGTNPLVYAAHFNKDEHARTLLSRGARLDHRGWETIGFRRSLPIEVAFQNRHYAMITHFLEEGSPVPPHIFTDSFLKCDQIFNAIPSSIARVLVQSDDFAETLNNCLNEATWRAMKTSNQLLVFGDATEQDLIAIIRRFLQVADEYFTPNSIREAFLRFAVGQGYFSAARYLLTTLGTPLPSDLLVKLHRHSGRWKTTAMIRFLVDTGADVLVHTSNNDSVLHALLWAPGGNRYSIADANEDDILGAVQLLVGYGCDPLEADSRGNTPLHIAVKRGYISVARYLLTLGAPLPPDLLVTLDRDQSHWNTAPMIHFLVENGANILAYTNDGDSVLHIVLRCFNDDKGTLDAVKALAGYGCNPLKANSRGETPVYIAVEQGHISAARYLLTLGAHIPPDLFVTLYRHEWRWRTAPMIQFMVENGANALAHTSDGDSVLHIALRCFIDDNDVLEVVKLLVGHGCDPLEANPRGHTPLHIAVEEGHISTARYLLTLAAPLPPDLLVALNHDRLPRTRIAARMIRLLVENGANALSHNSNGDSVLHLVLQAFYDDDEVWEAVKFLVGHGCDPLEANSQGNTPLQIAVARGHMSVARYLLTLGASLPPDVLVTWEFRGCQWCSTARMITLVIENGVNVLGHASNGDSVLHIVLESLYSDDEAWEVVKLLVGCGCNPLEADSRGNTPLHIAVERGYVSVARYLLTLGASLPPDLLVTWEFSGWQSTAYMIPFLVENGVDILAHTFSNGDSVLHVTLQSLYDDNEALETVKLLIGYGCDPLGANFRGDTPLHIAVEQGHISTARYLLTLGSAVPPDLLVTLNPDESSWSSAHMLRFFVDNGVDVLARAGDGDSVLHIALRSLYNGNKALETLKLLVGYGCDPLEANSHGDTPLHIAVSRGHISAARYLLTLGAYLPPDLLVTLEGYWSGQKTVPMICFLVANGVDILARTSDGDSVLHIALQSLYEDSEALETAKLLVAYGCDPFETNSCGNSPLRIAVEQGHISAARYLLTLGTPLPPDLLVTLKDHCYWPARKTVPMIRFLVANGVDVLALTSDGDSVLHIALESSYYADDKALETVELLVGYGCDPLKANSRGNTPLQIAVERGYISVARYLLSTLGAPLPPDLLVTLNHDRLHWSTTPMIRFLVDKGVDVFAHASNGDSVLHIALQCFNNDKETLGAVKALVDYGCDFLEANPCGNTPLHIAVGRGHISAARYLLTLGATLPPDLLVTLNRDWSRWSAVPMLRFLIKNGVDVHAHASDGDSVLHIVLRCFTDDKETLEAVKVLVGYDCDPLKANSHGYAPLHIAVERGHISAARYLLTLGAPLPPDLLVTLNRDQSYWGTTPMIRFLVENGVNVFAHSSDGDSVLHIMLQCFNDDKETLEAVKVLISFGGDPLEANSRGNTPLHIAVERGLVSAARYLLTLGAALPPDLLVTLNRDRSCWSTAPMIRFLVKNGVDVHAYASDGDSVLHIALRCFNEANDVLDAVKLLVGYGCDPLEANSCGETPLHLAVERSYVSVAQYLITQGASVLTKVSNGDTLLHFATGGAYRYPYDEDEDGCALKAIKFLVRCGCEPAVSNDDGQTPLHIAVNLGRIKTIKYLLSLNISLPCDILFTAIQSDNNSAYRRYIIETLVTSGCDSRTPNADGDTPLRVAIMKGKVDVVEYLLSVASVYHPPLEDLLSATALALPSVRSEMRRILSARRTMSESPALPPAKRVRFS